MPVACGLVTPADIKAATGLAVNAGQDITAETGWTSACAWSTQAARGEGSYGVQVKFLARGTLATIGKMADATPIAALSDEAYAFDKGRQVAMRFRDVIAIVAGGRGIDGKGVPATAVEALVRLVAQRVRS